MVHRLPHGLDRALFDAVTAQLTAKATTVKTGTIVDATIIASASEDDGKRCSQPTSVQGMRSPTLFAG